MSFNLLHILCFISQDVEDWFGYCKLNVFLSYKCLAFMF